MKMISQILAAAVVASGVAVALPSCAETKVPADANLVSQGIGDTAYVVGQSGTIYVYDKTWNKMVYSGHVNAGQRVELSARHDKLLVDGVPRVEQIPLGEGSKYQFFLRADPVVRRTVIEEVPSTTVERRTVVEPAPVIERRTVIEREVP
jgi:hypothetical protein